MASAPITHSRPRVSPLMACLLKSAWSVDSYWSRKALTEFYIENQMRLDPDERDAFSLIHRGLFRLFAFDPDLDAGPRHAV